MWEERDAGPRKAREKMPATAKIGLGEKGGEAEKCGRRKERSVEGCE